MASILFVIVRIPQPIQMQLSKKAKTFSELCAKFQQSSCNFEHFRKKDRRHSLCISDIGN